MSVEEKEEVNVMQEGEESFSVAREIISWIITIAVAVIFALLINHFLIVNANVPTGSMESTIMPGDRLIGNRLAYIKKEPQRGDVIIFKYPVDETENYIKRLIGLPGEKLEIKAGKVYINGEPLDEPYLKEEWVIANDGIGLQIPEGCYFMMGDNRNNSADSRYWVGEAIEAGLAKDQADGIAKKYCFVQKDQILGKAVFRYFPKFKTFPAVTY
ncbi:MAG: signal peptidase I [Lachnospiraceae bacterium]|nr:signal peptidase I [Lachnospiraceae bacterium]